MAAAEDDKDLNDLLDYLNESRGFDFTTYKPTTLTRRIRRRMADVSIETYPDYRDYLEVHSDEFEALVNTILINVTSFFREPETWDFLRDDVLPRLLSDHDGEPLRLWSAGCASGEEAYSLAMLVAEAVGTDTFRERVKIYATDVDDHALSVARAGLYPAKSLEAVPAELRDRYFKASSAGYTFNSDLRRTVIFGRHDLTSHAPISRIDLLTCRNTLMYFNAEAQTGIVRRLYFALRPRGFLMLGKAETIMRHSSLFTAHEPALRVFTKVLDDRARNHVSHLVPTLGGVPELGGRLIFLAHDESELARIVLNPDLGVMAVNDQARSLFGLDPRDVGKAFQDLEVSYRPIELRASIDEAVRTRRPVVIGNVERTRPDGKSQRLRVTITPLPLTDSVTGVSLEFTDITAGVTLEEELERSAKELETAHEELQTTNEELETTNEELQSTNEELETTNEELQSTVEELETTNEELRSTNEELETMNDELRAGTTEVDDANAYLAATVSSLGVAIVVLDQGHLVHSWSSQAEDLWGLRSDEVVGKDFFALDIGLAVGELRDPVERCLRERGRQQIVLDATNRRGRQLRCRVACNPLSADDGDGVVVVMHEDGADAALPA